MNFTLREITEIRPSLEKFVKVELPAIPSFRLGRALKQIQQDFQEFEKQREVLVRKYGVLDPEKGEIRVPPDRVEEFMNEFNALLDEKVDINFEPISLKLIGEAKISIEDMNNLQMLFVDD